MNLQTPDRRQEYGHRTDRAEVLARYFHEAGDVLPGPDYDDELREGAELKYGENA